MSLYFEEYASAGNEFVQLVAEEMKISPGEAGKIIRGVLHALRNRISHEESFKLLAQLPMALKGVYVDGWKFSKDFTPISSLHDFWGELKQEGGSESGYKFDNNGNAMAAVTAVFNAMRYFVPEEEMNDIIDVMPGKIKKAIRECINGNQIIL